jgi:hypothetical protein
MTDAALVRAWLRESGEEVSARGPLAQADIDRYETAHAAGPDWDAADDANFGDDLSEAGPPPADEVERKPRTVATPKPAARIAGWRKARARKPKGKAKPRVPVDDLIAGVWRGLAGFARPLPATSRLLKIQAPVAGVILEDTVKGTVVDHWLQPLARTSKSAEAIFALAGPPILVTAVQLQPDSAPFILPLLRESLLSWCKIAGPKMADALKRETEFEAEFGQDVDQMIAFLFSDALVEDEEQAVRAQQQAMQDAAA